MHRTPVLGRPTRFVAAALAAGITWGLFGGIVSLGASEHTQLIAAVAARQASANGQALMAAAPGMEQRAQLVAFAP